MVCLNFVFKSKSHRCLPDLVLSEYLIKNCFAIFAILFVMLGYLSFYCIKWTDLLKCNNFASFADI